MWEYIHNGQIRHSIKLQCPKCFGSSRVQKLPRRRGRRMLVTPKAFLPLLLLALPSLADEGILDCLTGPCVTVSGVGKLQGTWKSTQWTDRRVYQFMGIPFGETTGGEHRSCLSSLTKSKILRLVSITFFFFKDLVHHVRRVLWTMAGMRLTLLTSTTSQTGGTTCALRCNLQSPWVSSLPWDTGSLVAKAQTVNFGCRLGSHLEGSLSILCSLKQPKIQSWTPQCEVSPNLFLFATDWGLASACWSVFLCFRPKTNPHLKNKSQKFLSLCQKIAST